MDLILLNQQQRNYPGIYGNEILNSILISSPNFGFVRPLQYYLNSQSKMEEKIKKVNLFSYWVYKIIIIMSHHESLMCKKPAVVINYQIFDAYEYID